MQNHVPLVVQRDFERSLIAALAFVIIGGLCIAIYLKETRNDVLPRATREIEGVMNK